MDLLDLGAPLIGRSEYLLSWKADNPRFTDLPIVDVDGVAQPERLLQARPDMILALTYQLEGVRAEVARIAPLVEVPDEFGNDWREMWRMTALACGLDPVEARLADVAARTARVGTEGGARGSAAIVRPMPDGQFRVYGPTSFCGGLRPLAGDPQRRPGGERVSVENFALLDADVLLCFYYSANNKAFAEARPFHPLLGRLTAVQRGRHHPVGFHLNHQRAIRAGAGVTTNRAATHPGSTGSLITLMR